jgi:hypothetical protein
VSLRNGFSSHRCQLGDAPYLRARSRHGYARLSQSGRTAVLDIEHSLRWHDPDRFNGYVLSRHLAGTPVDAFNLRDALRIVKDRAVSRGIGSTSAFDHQAVADQGRSHVVR